MTYVASGVCGNIFETYTLYIYKYNLKTKKL